MYSNNVIFVSCFNCSFVIVFILCSGSETVLLQLQWQTTNLTRNWLKTPKWRFWKKQKWFYVHAQSLEVTKSIITWNCLSWLYSMSTTILMMCFRFSFVPACLLLDHLVLDHLFVRYLDQETAKAPFRSSSQAATYFYLSNYSMSGRGIPWSALPKDTTSELVLHTIPLLNVK